MAEVFPEVSALEVLVRLPSEHYAEVTAFAATINATFLLPTGEKIPVTADIGDNFLEVAHENGIDIEGTIGGVISCHTVLTLWAGACGGECACSTCHVVLEDEMYSKLPPPADEEEDMLDLALGLTDT